MTRDDFESAAADWLKHLRDERLLKLGTVRTYQSTIRYLVAALPEIYTADDLMAAIKERIGPRATPHVRRSSYITLNGFFRWREKNGGPPNPLGEVKSPPASQARRRALTPAEDSELTEVITSSPPALRLQLHLMRGLGLRLGDVVGLQVRDLDLTGNRIRCRNGKGGTDVWLPLGAGLAADVREYLKGRPELAEGWLFPSPAGGGHLTTRAVDKAFRKARGSRLGAVSLHCLRHSFCTDLVDHGVPIHTVQKLMRHTNMAVTAGYMGSDPGAQATAVDDLQARLTPADKAADKTPPAVAVITPPARAGVTGDDLELRLGPAPVATPRRNSDDVRRQLREKLGPFLNRDDVIFEGAYGYAEGWQALGARLRDYLSFAPAERDRVRSGPLTYRPANGAEIVIEGHTYGMLLELIESGPTPVLRVLH